MKKLGYGWNKKRDLYFRCYREGVSLAEKGKPRPLIIPNFEFESEAKQKGYDDFINEKFIEEK